VSLEYCHPAESDVEAVTDVLNRSRRELPLHLDQSVEEVEAQTFKNTDYNPNGFWLALRDSQIIGYGGALIEKSRIEAGFNDGWITIEVIPEYRGKGIEQELMRRALNYLTLKEIGTAQRWCKGTKGWRHNLLLEFGFTAAHYEYVMVWKGETPERYPLPGIIHLQHTLFREATNEEVETFVEVFNDAFKEYYNFSPATVERFIKSREIDRNIWRITFAKDGSRIVGVLKCCESVQYNKENNTKIGWVDILGVIKGYRRKGIGKALLSDGMAWIYDRGMDTIYLDLNAENRNALSLYTSLGFKIDREDTIYREKLE